MHNIQTIGPPVNARLSLQEELLPSIKRNFEALEHMFVRVGQLGGALDAGVMDSVFRARAAIARGIEITDRLAEMQDWSAPSGC